MHDWLPSLWASARSIPWLELLRAAAAVATAIIAYLALKNWQRQDKAKMQSAFLDAVLEATHEFIMAMGGPLELVRIVRFGLDAYRPPGASEDAPVQGVIEYIKNRGESDSRLLHDALSEAKPAYIRLKSLAAKGQSLGFPGYAACQDAIVELTSHLDRVTAVAGIIRYDSWYWENPQVRALIEKLMRVDVDEMQSNIRENNIIVLEFARRVYRDTYG